MKATITIPSQKDSTVLTFFVVLVSLQPRRQAGQANGQGTYNYYNPVYQRNKEPPKHYKNHYTTDLLWNKSKGFLDEARTAGGPFFLTMATVAPHNGGGPRPPGVPNYGPVPATKFANYFNDEQVPRGKNFNPDEVFQLTLMSHYLLSLL